MSAKSARTDRPGCCLLIGYTILEGREIMTTRDQIVETRTWGSGAEIIARVNWSHVARIRQALGIAGDELGRRPFEQLVNKTRVTWLPRRVWPQAQIRAA